MGKYIGIDYGAKRIGLALSDEEGSFAFPKGIVTPETLEEEISLLCTTEPIEGIIIGHSLASNGEENSLSSSIQHIAKKLESYAPVVLQHEGFSSFEAHRYQTTKGARDDSAAAIILQRFLDKKRK